MMLIPGFGMPPFYVVCEICAGLIAGVTEAETRERGERHMQWHRDT